MSFRWRLTLGVALAAFLPLAALTFATQRGLDRRMVEERGRQAMAAAGQAGQAIRQRHADVQRRTAAAAAALGGDRRAAGDLLRMAELAGLDALELYDRHGRVLASAHFPEDAGRQALGLPPLLAAIEAPLVVRTRSAAEPFLVLAASVPVGGGSDSLLLLGGMRLEVGGLPGRGAGADLSLELPGVAAPAGVVVRLGFPFMDALRAAPVRDTAYISIVPGPGGEVVDLAADLERRLWLGALGAALLAGLAALLIAARLRRPVSQLVTETDALDLHRLDAGPPRGDGELAAVGAALDGLRARLRVSTTRLVAAERRAAAGDAARQATHDLRNGIAPIRHVLRHLDEVARAAPETLPAIYAERAPSLHGAVEYLDALAADWATRGTSAPDHADPAVVAQRVAVELGDRRVSVEAAAVGRAAVAPMALHRILANLAGNALQSLPDHTGTVRLAVREGGGRVAFEVQDTGRGMTRADLERALAGGWTTHPAGSGMGLAVVRRLVEDAGGALTIETAPGEGTLVKVSFPLAQAAAS